MLRKIIIITNIYFIYSFQLFSQTPSYYHYTSTDGLASSTVFQVVQDKEGFIWFATQNGASRFDGKRFKTYQAEDGLNSNMITSIVVGDNNELYFGNYEKGINILKEGKIKDYYHELNKESIYITFLINDNSDKNKIRLLANIRSGNIITIDEANNRISKGKILLELFTLIKVKRLLNGKILVLTTKGISELIGNKLTKLKIKNFPDVPALSLSESKNGSYFIGTKGKIYCVRDNSVIDSFMVNVGDNNEVHSIVNDRNGNLWFAVSNKGFFKISKGTKIITDIGSKMDLQTTNVNYLFEDDEGNIWAATYGKGVYCLNNFFLSNYDEKDGLSSNSIHAIAKDKSDRVFIGTYNGLNIFENGKFQQKKINKESPLTEYIFDIKIYNDAVYVGGGFLFIDRKISSYEGLNLVFYSRQSFIRTSWGLNILGSIGNNLAIHKNYFADRFSFQQYFVFGDKSLNNRINNLLEDSERNIWVATTLGLCKLSNYTEKDGKAYWDKTFFPSDPVLSEKIKAIYQDSNNNIWFAGDRGIAFYNLRTDSMISYTTKNGFDFSSSTSFAEDSKNRIWIGNMKGLYLMDGNSIKYLNSQSGLPTDEVLSLFYDKEINRLYVGTSNGISILDINFFDNIEPNPPEVNLLSINAGGKFYNNYKNLLFEPEQNSVYIEFAAMNFSSPGSVKYKYKLKDQWVETDYNFLSFTSLNSGKYNIEIAAKAQNTEWSNPVKISFIILPRFVETFWFTLLIFGLILSIVFSIVLWRIKLLSKKNKDKIELTERINELKHQALSAMMNPHFIFNSLNSVQYLINSKRNEEANNYIAMMAKLIRKNLDAAGSGFILLSEEIKRLKLYLDLEKLRFQEKFSYEINIGTTIEIDSIKIPNMIIQPFVENSLWHGIINSGNNGQLTISFLFENIDIDSTISKSLIIKVTDNGIGIKQALKNKKDDHISKGIQIIEERLRLLSAKMKLPKPIILEDLSERDINSHGTEVIISLSPPLYKFVLIN